MSSDDADDECESPVPPAPTWTDPRTLRFTVFVLVPGGDVCTLRDLPSGIPVTDLKARLELLAGVPGQIYTLVYPDGEELGADQRLVVNDNVLHGYVLKIRLLDTWESLYQSVSRNNIEQVYHSGGVHLRGNIHISGDEATRYEEMARERSAVALFVAAFQGRQRMINMLLSVGVDPNVTTVFGRSAIFAAVAKDQVVVMEFLVAKGAILSRPDFFGKTPMAIAHEMESVLCSRKIRLIQLNLRGKSASDVNSKSLHSSLRKEPHLDRAKLKSTLSNYSDSNASEKSKNRIHATRKDISASAPGSRMSKNSIERTHSSLSSATTSKIRQKYNVKWKETSTEYTYWRVKDSNDVQEAVKVIPVTYSVPKTLLKFSDVHTAQKDAAYGDKDATKEEKPEIIQAMKFTNKKLHEFKKLSKADTKYVPMAERKKQRYRATPTSTSETFRRWLQRKEEEQEAAMEAEEEAEAEGQEFNVSDPEEDRMYEFNKRVRKMNRNEVRCLTPGNRPIMNLLEFASTTEGDGRNPPPEGNIRAYNEWKTKKRGYQDNLPKLKSSTDLMVEKRRLEEKRQKLLLSAISYDEWMDHAEERKSLIRQILRADLGEMRRLEEEKMKDRQRLYSYDVWREQVSKRESDEKRRRQIQRQYERELQRERDAFRGSHNGTFHDWLNKKRNDGTADETNKSITADKPHSAGKSAGYDMYQNTKGAVIGRNHSLRNSAPLPTQTVMTT